MLLSNDLIKVLMAIVGVGVREHGNTPNTMITFTTPNATPFTVSDNGRGNTVVTYGEHVVTITRVVQLTETVIHATGDNVNYVVADGNWAVYRLPLASDELPNFTGGKLNVTRDDSDGKITVTHTVDGNTVLQICAAWENGVYGVHVEFFV